MNLFMGILTCVGCIVWLVFCLVIWPKEDTDEITLEPRLYDKPMEAK